MWRLSIRRGQEEGTIRAPSQVTGPPGRDALGIPSPAACFGGTHERADIYAVTDDVTDDAFEEAITEAKAGTGRMRVYKTS